MITSIRVSGLGVLGRYATDLAPVTALTGPNGSGKSTLFAALAYGLTGDPSLLGGSEAACLSTPDEQPEIELELDLAAAGGKATLFRTCPYSGTKRARRKLTRISGAITAEADIAAEVGRWFGGLPPKVAASYAFIPQGRLLDVVDAQPAVRKQAVARLVGVEHAEVVWKALAAAERGPEPTDPQLIADLRARLAETEQSLQQAEWRLTQLPEDGTAQIAQLRKQQADAQQAARARQHYEQLVRDAQQARDRLTSLLEAVADKEAVLAQTPDPQQELQRLDEVARIIGVRQDRQRLLSEISRYDTTLCESQIDQPGPQPQPDELLSQARGMRGTWERLAKLPTGGPCPTCGQGTEACGEMAGQAKQLLAALQLSEQTFSQLIQQWEAAQRAWTEQQARFTQARHMKQVREEQLQGLPDHPDPGMDFATLQRHRDQVKRQVGQHQAAVGALQAARQVHQTGLGHVQTLDYQLSICPEPQMVPLPPTGLLEQLEAAERERAALAVQINSLRERHGKDAKMLNDVLARQANTAELVEKAHRVRKVREAFHRDAAPADVIAAYMVEREAAVNSWLETLAAEFRVTVTQDCDFAATFGDGTPSVSAHRLSGGEQLVLSWAWTAARLDRHGDQLWLLAVDEPTYGLDDIRMQALRSAIEGWLTRAGTGRQLILVTHDRRLADVADKVVVMPGRK